MNIRTLPGGSVATCAVCGGPCYELAGSQTGSQRRGLSGGDGRLWSRLPGLPVYPLRNGGWAALLAWGLLMGLVSVMDAITYFGPYGVLIKVTMVLLMLAYLGSFLVKIVERSASGEPELPDWPGADLWDEIVAPALKPVMAGAVSFAPAIGYRFAFPEEPIGLWGLLGLGWVYFPMALLALVLFETPLAMSPHIVVPAIARCGLDYALVLIGAVLLELAWGPLDSAAADVPVLGTMLSPIIAVYVAALQAHLIGSLYHANRYRLGWFESPPGPAA